MKLNSKIILMVSALSLVWMNACTTSGSTSKPSGKLTVNHAKILKTSVLYSDSDKVFFRICRDSRKLSQTCPQRGKVKSQPIEIYMNHVPLEVDSFARNEEGLRLIQDAIEAAKAVNEEDNQSSVEAIKKLEVVEANMKLLLQLRHDLETQGKDLTFANSPRHYSTYVAPFTSKPTR